MDEQKPERRGMPTPIGVALGILLAVAVLGIGYFMIHADDGCDCAMDNADRALAGEPARDCE